MARHLSLTCTHDPTIYAPAKYRRACKYDAYVPDALTGLGLTLDAEVAGVVSEAEAAIRALNGPARTGGVRIWQAPIWGRSRRWALAGVNSSRNRPPRHEPMRPPGR